MHVEKDSWVPACLGKPAPPYGARNSVTPSSAGADSMQSIQTKDVFNIWSLSKSGRRLDNLWHRFCLCCSNRHPQQHSWAMTFESTLSDSELIRILGQLLFKPANNAPIGRPAPLFGLAWQRAACILSSMLWKPLLPVTSSYRFSSKDIRKKRKKKTYCKEEFSQIIKPALVETVAAKFILSASPPRDLRARAPATEPLLFSPYLV